jgi:uncharacterized cupin superfamily protein
MPLTSIKPSGPAEIGGPAPDRLVSGTPVFTTWNLYEADGLYCGIWESTPGKWRIAYEEWEYCRILSGVSVITGTQDDPVTVKAGDSFMIPPGFEGTWEVLETTRKDYVIRT